MNESINDDGAEFDEQALLQELEPSIGSGAVTEKLFFIQEKKAALMAELESGLKQLDREGTVGQEGKMRRVTYDNSAEGLMVYGKGGEADNVSKGQLIVSGLWEEEYFLDESVPRDIKKRYLVQRIHYKIADLFDHQIALFEGSQIYNKNTGFDDAYQAIASRYDEGAEVVPGVLAEKMVESFVTKLTYDYDMPYRLRNVSVYEDVEYKIDFIIELHDESDVVGVKVESNDKPDIAIQFTTSQSDITIDHKTRQINRAKGNIDRDGSLHVKDLVLIVIPINHVMDTYKEWQGKGKKRRAPGGPDELWSIEDKEMIFKGLLSKVLSDEKVEKAWGKVRK